MYYTCDQILAEKSVYMCIMYMYSTWDFMVCTIQGYTQQLRINWLYVQYKAIQNYLEYNHVL